MPANRYALKEIEKAGVFKKKMFTSVNVARGMRIEAVAYYYCETFDMYIFPSKTFSTREAGEEWLLSLPYHELPMWSDCDRISW